MHPRLCTALRAEIGSCPCPALRTRHGGQQAICVGAGLHSKRESGDGRGEADVRCSGQDPASSKQYVSALWVLAGQGLKGSTVCLVGWHWLTRWGAQLRRRRGERRRAYLSLPRVRQSSCQDAHRSRAASRTTPLPRAAAHAAHFIPAARRKVRGGVFRAAVRLSGDPSSQTSQSNEESASLHSTWVHVAAS